MERADKLFLLFLMLLPVSGCTPEDSERCLKGYRFDDDFQMCLKIQDTEGGTDTEPNGLGVPCYDNETCAGYLADECLLNPLAPDRAGICTVYNCTKPDCTGPYRCCDCTSQPSNQFLETDRPFCIPENETGPVEAFGCTCE